MTSSGMRHVIFVCGILTILAMPAVGHAQEATVTGTITDTTGGVLPGATVTAVNEASGNNFEAVTDARGSFRIAVRIGNYRVTATLAGFGAVARIENGHARGERDFSSVRFEGFAIELDGADDIVVDDVEF